MLVVCVSGTGVLKPAYRVHHATEREGKRGTVCHCIVLCRLGSGGER